MNLPNNTFDELIQLDYPQPIAELYQQLLAANTSAQKAELCIQLLDIVLRVVGFVLVIKYLNDNEVHDAGANKAIKENLSSLRFNELGTLIREILRAYKGHRHNFIITTLYDLYWRKSPENPDEQATPNTPFWQALKTAAKSEFLLKSGSTDIATLADDLMASVQTILEQFKFFTEWELWRIDLRTENYISVRIYRGLGVRRWHVTLTDMHADDRAQVELGRYFLATQQNRLFRLEPLLIDPRETLDNQSEFGLFSRYTEPAQTSMSGTLEYLLLATEVKETQNPTLIQNFRNLYVHRLKEKYESLHVPSAWTWTNFRQVLYTYSNEQLSPLTHHELGLAKYMNDVYVPRTALESVIQRFLTAPQVGLVITGNVGIGKTNVLIRFLEQTYAMSAQQAVLWLNGVTLDTEHSLTATLWNIFDLLFRFQHPVPTNSMSANRVFVQVVRELLTEQEMFILLLDAVNEHENAAKAFARINEFINFLKEANVTNIKVILTSRPQIWRYVRRRELAPTFRSQNYYLPDAENVNQESIKLDNGSVVLLPYTESEMNDAFERYRQKFRLQNTTLKELNSRLSLAVHDPLLLRIASQSYEGGMIPKMLSPDDLISQLIDHLISDPSRKLKKSDIDYFLQQVLMPLFFADPKRPTNRLTSAVIAGQKVGNVLLDDLITYQLEIDAETTANQRFLNLMNTGWLTLYGESHRYEVRFQYEYFYDYFAGQYLISASKQSEDHEHYFLYWISKLEIAPFLWGALRFLLIAYIKDVQSTIIERLGHTQSTIQRDLLVNVLCDYAGEDTTWLDTILGNWVKSTDKDLAALTATEIIFERQIEALVFDVLKSKNSDVRNFAVQHMGEFWRNNRAAAERALAKLVERLHWWQLSSLKIEGASLLNSCLVIVTNEYTENRMDFATSQSLQKIARAAINRGLRPWLFARYFLLSILLNPIYALLRFQHTAEWDIISLPDIESFFPPKPIRVQAFKQLIPHIDGLARDDLEPLDALASMLKEMIATDNDLVTAALFLFVMNANTSKKALEVGRFLQMLMDELIRVFPITTDPKHPTAPVWAFYLITPFDTIPYSSLTRGEAEEILTIQGDIVWKFEEHFRSSLRLASGRIIHRSLVAGCLIWGYNCDLEISSELLRRIARLNIDRKDHAHLRHIAYQLAESTEYYRAPEPCLRALSDFLSELKEYLDAVDLDTRHQFWAALEDSLAQYASKFPHHLLEFINNHTDQELPVEVKNKLLKARKAVDLSYELAESSSHFLNAALRSKNSFIRDNFKWVFRRALNTRNARQWFRDIAAHIVNIIYGEELFIEH